MSVNVQVSIGLPIYNGERYLALALDSLLQQTYEGFEIVIVDNASTDATPDICARYAATDRRIRYHRNPENIGAGRNFNVAFELARGQYFKWAAHDDIAAPTFLSRAVEVLDDDPGVSLCYSLTGLIDEAGNLKESGLVDVRADLPKASDRFREAVFGPRCYEVFGLIRADALHRTRLMGLHARGDGVLLARLAILGRFRLIDETLLFVRRHPTQSTRLANDYHAYARWFDPIGTGRFIFPDWRLWGEYLRALERVRLTPAQYSSCLASVLRWGYMNRRRLLRDIRVALETACLGESDPTRGRLLRLPTMR